MDFAIDPISIYISMKSVSTWLDLFHQSQCWAKRVSAIPYIDYNNSQFYNVSKEDVQYVKTILHNIPYYVDREELMQYEEALIEIIRRHIARNLNVSFYKIHQRLWYIRCISYMQDIRGEIIVPSIPPIEYHTNHISDNNEIYKFIDWKSILPNGRGIQNSELDDDEGDYIKSLKDAISYTFNRFSFDVQSISITRNLRSYQCKCIVDGNHLPKVYVVKNHIAMLERRLGLKGIQLDNAENHGICSFSIHIPSREMLSCDFFDVNFISKDLSLLQLPFLLGLDPSGKAIYKDLVSCPHILVGGATGMGKSIALSCYILSMIRCNQPRDLRLLLMDMKSADLLSFSPLCNSYLIHDIICDKEEAQDMISRLHMEMEHRKSLLKESNCINIDNYNQKSKHHMPRLVIFIDEFQEITYENEVVEDELVSILRFARSMGMHFILSTQRPDIKATRGDLKANIPYRISFKTSSKVDSNVTLGRAGAEALHGRGDCLTSDGQYLQIPMPPEGSKHSLLEKLASLGTLVPPRPLPLYGIGAAGTSHSNHPFFLPLSKDTFTDLKPSYI